VRGSFEPLLEVIGNARVTDMVSTEPTLEEIFLSYYTETAGSTALGR
jgi:hypothetical protein